jgi:hypothetical protein
MVLHQIHSGVVFRRCGNGIASFSGRRLILQNLPEVWQHHLTGTRTLEALVTVLLEAGLIREAATAVNNAPDGTIATEEDSTARYILTVALTYLEYGRELSASRVKQCVELVAEHTRMRKPGTCLLCGK